MNQIEIFGYIILERVAATTANDRPMNDPPSHHVTQKVPKPLTDVNDVARAWQGAGRDAGKKDANRVENARRHAI